ncbi:MAG: AraC family transcriptional regulator [Paludibacteraceae bacterium]|nr:AraC family transcriptional regulator [Paludibacteraceae bacterium]
MDISLKGIIFVIIVRCAESCQPYALPPASVSGEVSYLLMSVILFAVVVLIIAIYYIVKYHHINEKNRALKKMVAEFQGKKKNQGQKERDKESAEIYERLVNAVYAEKLYADLQIDRDSFAAHMNLSRHSLNMILRTNTKGLSFPQWLNTIRIEIASEMLQNEPEKPIAIIAKEVGLTPNNFHRLFRLRFGVTPTEYRQSKDSDTEKTDKQ